MIDTAKAFLTLFTKLDPNEQGEVLDALNARMAEDDFDYYLTALARRRLKRGGKRIPGSAVRKRLEKAGAL